MPAKQLHSQVRFWRDAALPGIEARLSAYRKHAFRTHMHAEYSVGLVEHGSTTFPLGGETYRAEAGQMVFIHPHEPHACNPDTQSGISYRMFYLAPGWLAGAAPDGRPPRFLRPVANDPELFAAWRALHEAYEWGAPLAEKQALLVTCLRELVQRQMHSPAQQAAPELTDAITRARQHLSASVGQRVPLGELAQVAGLSRHHFARAFKAATGLPPHTYQLQMALDHAKRLLAGGEIPISQAALDAGFADQSHFSRMFRQFTGATPVQYMRNVPCDNIPCDNVPCDNWPCKTLPEAASPSLKVTL